MSRASPPTRGAPRAATAARRTPPARAVRPVGPRRVPTEAVDFFTSRVLPWVGLVSRLLSLLRLERSLDDGERLEIEAAVAPKGLEPAASMTSSRSLRRPEARRRSAPRSRALRIVRAQRVELAVEVAAGRASHPPKRTPRRSRGITPHTAASIRISCCRAPTTLPRAARAKRAVIHERDPGQHRSVSVRERRAAAGPGARRGKGEGVSRKQGRTGRGGVKVADGAWKRARVVQIEGRAWAPSPGGGGGRAAPPRASGPANRITHPSRPARAIAESRPRCPSRARARPRARARACTRDRASVIFSHDPTRNNNDAARRSAAPRFTASTESGQREGLEKALRRRLWKFRFRPFSDCFLRQRFRQYAQVDRLMGVGLNRAELFVTQKSTV